MRVHESCHVQSSHDQLAQLVDRQVTCWKGRSVVYLPVTLIQMGALALETRVLAAVYGTLWTASEAICIVPRLASLGLGIALSHRVSVNMISRIVSVYATTLTTTVLQGASFIAAMTLPELFYAHFKGNKTFFIHHINVFVETLPDIPEVYSSTYDVFGVNPYESLTKLWLDLGYTNREWRKCMKLELCARVQQNPNSASLLLDPTSDNFRKALFTVLTEKTIPQLNMLAEAGQLTLHHVSNLDSKTMAWIYVELTPETRQAIFSLRPELETSLDEVSDHAGAVFGIVTDYRFRPPQAVRIASLLLELMKQVRTSLIRENIYTADEIENMMDAPMAAIFCQALYRFIASANISLDIVPHVIFKESNGAEIRISNDMQFYKTRTTLQELHSIITSLSKPQTEVLLKRLSFKDGIIAGSTDPIVQKAFEAIVSFRLILEQQVMSNDKYRLKDQTPWTDAFYSDT